MDFERVFKLDTQDLVNKIGDLYKFDDNVPSEIADRVEQMTTLQDEVESFLNEVKALADSYQQVTAENVKLKQTNTKLMYDSIRRNPEPSEAEKEKAELENAEELAQDIDIYEED